MTDKLADALTLEIARVSEMRDRLRDVAVEHPNTDCRMRITVAIMQNEIDRAVRALVGGELLEMMGAHKALKEYSDVDDEIPL